MTSISSTTASTTSTLPVTSTTASTTAPVTTTVTAQNPVDVAANKLSRTAVDNLWADKVTNASNVFTKFLGLFAYLAGLYSASKADTTEVKATIADFNQKACALVDALAKRSLTPAEASKVGVAGLKYGLGRPQQLDAVDLITAQNAEKAFYDVFKKRCTQLNVSTGSTDFGVYTQAAINKVNAKAAFAAEDKGVFGVLPKDQQQVVALLPEKVATAINGFSQRIYVDMVNGFADQPATSITMAGFKQKAIDMKGFFPGNSAPDIEASLRQALKAKNDQAFNALSTEFLNPDPSNAKVAELKASMKTQFEAEKAAIESELGALRGPSGWNGSIHEANQTLEAARIARDAARAELFTVLGMPSNTMDDTALATLLAGTFTTGIVEKRDSWLAKVATYNTALQARDTLVARLAELAQYDINGAVVGGKLAQVNANLQDANLGSVARAEATKIGNFYKELHIDVTTANKAARYARMHVIIGN